MPSRPPPLVGLKRCQVTSFDVFYAVRHDKSEITPFYFRFFWKIPKNGGHFGSKKWKMTSECPLSTKFSENHLIMNKMTLWNFSSLESIFREIGLLSFFGGKMRKMQKNAHFSHVRPHNFLKNDSIDLKFLPKVGNQPLLQFVNFHVHSSYKFWVITKNLFHFLQNSLATEGPGNNVITKNHRKNFRIG